MRRKNIDDDKQEILLYGGVWLGLALDTYLGVRIIVHNDIKDKSF